MEERPRPVEGVAHAEEHRCGQSGRNKQSALSPEEIDDIMHGRADIKFKFKYYVLGEADPVKEDKLYESYGY